MEGTITTGSGTVILSGAQANISDLSISSRSSFEVGFPLSNFPSVAQQRAEFSELNSLTLTDAHFNQFVKSLKGENRYSDVLPYTFNNVPLSVPPRYINASYIHGIQVPADERLYIATQGPLPKTVSSFWAMVWEQRTSAVIMLCNVTENNNPKCAPYWSEEPIRCAGITITLIASERTVWGVRREFKLEANGEERRVEQLHFTGWPDHGVPTDPRPLDNLIKDFQDLKARRTGPVVVHCSAGVGRSGTFIALDCLYKAIQFKPQGLSVFSIVRRLREQRIMMVQVVEQYHLIYTILKNWVRS